MRVARPALAAILLLAAACKSQVDDGYAIDLTITVDPSVSDAQLAAIVLLHLDVSGAESFATDVPAGDKLSSRSAGLRYRPGVASGKLTFKLGASDANGAPVAAGELDDLALVPGTSQATLTLLATQSLDGGIDGGPTCGNGVVDPGEACDPGAGSATPCPQSVADCDDHNACTNDSFSGSACQAACAHTPIMDGSGCGAGVCLNGTCCLGCIKAGVCLPGNADKQACGSGGNSCFDCTTNSASATCNAGTCSGCDATSCTADGRTCGTSSCGFNCGGCPDACVSGAITHYACVNKSCQTNGGGNCGLYASCASGTTCATSCTGDGSCVPTAYCNSAVSPKACKPKVALGAACSAETTGDHECQSPYVCSWGPNGTSGYCVSTRCTGCAAANTSGVCGDFIKYGLDPRMACQGYSPTACHQNYCAGFSGDPMSPNPPACDYGLDQLGENWRPCGTVSCTNNTSGAGVQTGQLCTTGNVCGSGQTNTCSDGFRTCYPCSGSSCNYNAGFSC